MYIDKQRLQEIARARQQLHARDKKRLGRCYELAGQRLLELWEQGDREVTLVHGTVGPNANPHAWLEWPTGSNWDDPGMVWEPASDVKAVRPLYYYHFRAQAHARYTPQEALALIALSSTWGPWHEGC